ncbi:MAG TPA: carboxypeptidase-like regulatory domain-containing protein, partial [Pyrinomonadaceae bacterium]|nr:carboxypeptidase-like regulatory domain-containing protein [Pyrinomonadaceae bacterium]
MKSRFIINILTLALAFLAAPGIFAQAAGSLSGTVTDQAAALVPGVTVTVVNTSTNLTRTITTNAEGRWTVTLLPVGKYNVTYDKEGFKKAVNENIEVEASVPRTIDAILEVGGSDVIITVTSDQPLIQSETAAI